MEESLALVTGAGRGIGRAIADELVQTCRVVYADRCLPEELKAPERSLALVADVTDRDGMTQMYEKAREHFGRYPNIVVCNAGILQPTDFLDIELDEWKRIHEVNLHGVFNTMQLGCRGMVKDSKEWASARSHDGAAVGGATAASAAAPEKATGALPAEDAAAGGGSAGAPGGTGFFGRVITIASQAVFFCGLGLLPSNLVTNQNMRTVDPTGRSVSKLGGAHYTSSKAGAIGVTRAAAFEMGKYGITCNAICPGIVVSEMSLPQIQDIANLVKFLASRESSYITGACLDINGGNIMM